jgi:hypothetical protein
MNIPTLQDLPDDVLEIIYNDLAINETVQTNVAIHRRICKSKITKVYKIENMINIPKKYHRYIHLTCPLNTSDLNGKFKDTDLFGLCIDKDVYDTSALVNLKYLKVLKLHENNNYIDLNELVNLTYLSFEFSMISQKPLNLSNLTKLICIDSNITNVDNLVNLTYLDCWNTRITDLSKLVNLTWLDCSKTNIKDLNNLVKLKYLCCYNTTIENIDMLINLERLVAPYSNIININHLVNLKRIDITNTKVKDISNLLSLTEIIYDCLELVIDPKTNSWNDKSYKMIFDSDLKLPRNIYDKPIIRIQTR